MTKIGPQGNSNNFSNKPVQQQQSQIEQQNVKKNIQFAKNSPTGGRPSPQASNALAAMASMNISPAQNPFQQKEINNSTFDKFFTESAQKAVSDIEKGALTPEFLSGDTLAGLQNGNFSITG